MLFRFCCCFGCCFVFLSCFFEDRRFFGQMTFVLQMGLVDSHNPGNQSISQSTNFVSGNLIVRLDLMMLFCWFFFSFFRNMSCACPVTRQVFYFRPFFLNYVFIPNLFCFYLFYLIGFDNKRKTCVCLFWYFSNNWFGG